MNYIILLALLLPAAVRAQHTDQVWYPLETPCLVVTNAKDVLPGYGIIRIGPTSDENYIFSIDTTSAFIRKTDTLHNIDHVLLYTLFGTRRDYTIKKLIRRIDSKYVRYYYLNGVTRCPVIKIYYK